MCLFCVAKGVNSLDAPLTFLDGVAKHLKYNALCFPNWLKSIQSGCLLVSFASHTQYRYSRFIQFYSSVLASYDRTIEVLNYPNSTFFSYISSKAGLLVRSSPKPVQSFHERPGLPDSIQGCRVVLYGIARRPGHLSQPNRLGEKPDTPQIKPTVRKEPN